MNEIIMKIIPLFFTFLFIALFTTYCSNNKNKTEKVEKSKVIYNLDEAKKFVSKIEELGFFKYAEKKNIESLKLNFIENYDPKNEIVTIWDDETGIPEDYRYYICDGEDLYEQGGFTEMLKTLKPTFEKINFKCYVENHFEEWDQKNKWLNHSINLNGTDYVIFKNFTENGWGEVAMRFADILNAEFEKQKIEERIYLASGGNDGRLVFLNKELYEYINSVYNNKQWKPLEINEWCRTMNVKKMKLE
jgi:hypothetical protein